MKGVAAVSFLVMVALRISPQLSLQLTELSSNRMDPQLCRTLWSRDALHCPHHPALVISEANHLPHPHELPPFYHCCQVLVAERAYLRDHGRVGHSQLHVPLGRPRDQEGKCLTGLPAICHPWLRQGRCSNLFWLYQLFHRPFLLGRALPHYR